VRSSPSYHVILRKSRQSPRLHSASLCRFCHELCHLFEPGLLTLSPFSLDMTARRISVRPASLPRAAGLGLAAHSHLRRTAFQSALSPFRPSSIGRRLVPVCRQCGDTYQDHHDSLAVVSQKVLVLHRPLDHVRHGRLASVRVVRKPGTLLDCSIVKPGVSDVQLVFLISSKGR